MTPTDSFVLLVAKMRFLQKEYFSSRDSMTLRACKKAEAEVDKHLQGIEPAPQGVQMSLF